MVNFLDPVIVGQDYLLLKSLHHTTNGIYLWEFFTTLDYEFNIVRGRRPYRWTLWIYSLTRVATLIAVILNFIGLNTMTPINCQLWITFEAIFGYFSCTASALLIVLRIVAIWNRNRVVVAIAASLWVIEVATVIQGIARLRSNWYDFLPGCIIFNSRSAELNLIVTLFTDIGLLLTMLFGLFRLRREGRGTIGIGSLLWKQGVLWLLLATVAEVPPAVLTIMNLNVPLNLVSLHPAMVIMTIAATRMYRSLSDFVSETTIVSNGLQNSNSNILPKLKWKPSPRSQIEVTVDTSYEWSRMSRTSHRNAHIISTEGRQPCEKSHKSQGWSMNGLNNDTENLVENRLPV